MNKQLGYTLIDVLMAVAVVATLALGGLASYAIYHFIVKFW